MIEEERCIACNNIITKNMDICPFCGSLIHRIDPERGKNIEYLEKIENTLCHLEEELDAFLCKKR